MKNALRSRRASIGPIGWLGRIGVATLAIGAASSVAWGAWGACSRAEPPQQVVAAADASPPAAPAGAAQSPLRGLAPPAADELTHGVVRERLEAGPYTYLRVEDADSGHEAWLATLGAGAALGSEVELRNLGTRTSFVSKRLGRTFERLTFAWISNERKAEDGR